MSKRRRWRYEDLSATADAGGWSAWRTPRADGDGVQRYRTACCDCGLVHELMFFVDVDGEVAISFRRDNRATGQIRWHLRRAGGTAPGGRRARGAVQLELFSDAAK